MIKENPFDKLGLKKQVVEVLAKTGKLDEFLRDYQRMVLLRIHPDVGGDNGLSAIVNSSLDEIKRNPNNIGNWISGMQNGNSEYLAVIEALTGEVERLRNVEKDYDSLRVKYAESLATGSGVKADVKTAKGSSAPRATRSSGASGSASSARARTPSSAPRASGSTGTGTASSRTTTPIEKILGKYSVISSSTYALGVHELLRKAEAEHALGHPKISISGKVVYRPFTFEEDIAIRVEAYEKAGSEEERLKLFDNWLDSCTGIAYKAETTKFKIILVCNELITIDEGVRSSFLSGSYRGFTGIALDSSDGKYNTGLSKSEILVHPAWLACVNDNKPLLKTYTDIVFAEYAKKYGKAEKLMGFYVRQNTDSDELRAVGVHYLGVDSDADGDWSLNFVGRFLLRSPVAKKI